MTDWPDEYTVFAVGFAAVFVLLGIFLGLAVVVLR